MSRMHSTLLVSVPLQGVQTNTDVAYLLEGLCIVFAGVHADAVPLICSGGHTALAAIRCHWAVIRHRQEELAHSTVSQ